MCDDNQLETPRVTWCEVWPELLALGATVVFPLLFLVLDLADRKPDLFPRAGQIGLFIVAVLHFKALSDLNRKHVLNALRATKGEKILQISVVRTNLGWLTLIAAIYAAAIAAFGDKFVIALVKLLGG